MYLGPKFVWAVRRLYGAARGRKRGIKVRSVSYLHHLHWFLDQVSFTTKHFNALLYTGTRQRFNYLFPGEALGSLDFLRGELNGAETG